VDRWGRSEKEVGKKNRIEEGRDRKKQEDFHKKLFLIKVKRKPLKTFNINT